MKRMNQKTILILKLFMINLVAEMFTNPRGTGAALTRPKRPGVTGAETTNITTEKVLIGVRGP